MAGTGESAWTTARFSDSQTPLRRFNAQRSAGEMLRSLAMRLADGFRGADRVPLPYVDARVQRRIAQERVPTVPKTLSIPGLLAGYRDRMVAQGGCREPEAVGHCYRRHLHQPGRVSGLSYYDQ